MAPAGVKLATMAIDPRQSANAWATVSLLLVSLMTAPADAAEIRLGALNPQVGDTVTVTLALDDLDESECSFLFTAPDGSTRTVEGRVEVGPDETVHSCICKLVVDQSGQWTVSASYSNSEMFEGSRAATTKFAVAPSPPPDAAPPPPPDAAPPPPPDAAPPPDATPPPPDAAPPVTPTLPGETPVKQFRVRAPEPLASSVDAAPRDAQAALPVDAAPAIDATSPAARPPPPHRPAAGAAVPETPADRDLPWAAFIVIGLVVLASAVTVTLRRSGRRKAGRRSTELHLEPEIHHDVGTVVLGGLPATSVSVSLSPRRNEATMQTRVDAPMPTSGQRLQARPRLGPVTFHIRWHSEDELS